MTKNLQIQKPLPAPKIIVDKLSQILTQFSPKEFIEVVQNSTECFCEEIKGSGIWTPYRLRLLHDCDNLAPIERLDIVIIGIFSAAREQKLEHITLNQICRALSGDSGRARDMTALKNQITNSIRKLRSLEITVDATEAYQKLGYKMDKATLTDALLPCAIVKFIKINGQNTTAFKIHDESPLMKVAEAKKQIARISKEAWNVPLNHTPRATKIECELLYAVQTIVRAKKINPNILLSRLYAAAGLSDLTDGMDNNQCVQIFKARQKVRTTIETILNHWKGQGMFAQWYFTMVNSQGRVVRHRGKNKVHGISIISE